MSLSIALQLIFAPLRVSPIRLGSHLSSSEPQFEWAVVPPENAGKGPCSIFKNAALTEAVQCGKPRCDFQYVTTLKHGYREVLTFSKF